jgi:hypothetical protein
VEATARLGPDELIARFPGVVIDLGRAGELQVQGATTAMLTPGRSFFNSNGLILRTIEETPGPLTTRINQLY